MAKVITTEELKNKIDSDEEFYLVDVLSSNSYEGRHIPTAINFSNGPDFLEDFENKTEANKDDEIIVYCSSENCMASVQAAKTLEKAGYTNVVHYKDGLAGWQNAGYDFEGKVDSD
ncbi:MAG: rhodanese-like domain-containing protein [Candidatus Paceibacterota bacterium]